MKIIKYKKMTKGRYKVTFDTAELILYEDVIIKNNLLIKKNITLELLEKLLEENKYFEIYNISLNYIEIKLRTELELKKYLMKKLYPEDLINNIISRLKKEKYIDEERYIQAYINDKINLSNKGPFKIKRELLDLGLNETKIDEYLQTIDYDIWKEKISKIVNKYLKIMNHKSLNMIKNKLKLDLYNLGYQNELIESFVNKLNKDDNENLKKDYIKCLKKYEKKYDGYILETKIKNYLFNKGYKIEDITSLINNKD